MKKILGIVVLGLLLSSCEPNPKIIDTSSQNDFKIIVKQQGYKYFAQAHRTKLITAEGLPDKIVKGSGAGASKISQQEANQVALNQCGYSDCIVSKIGDRVTPTANKIINSRKKIVKKTAPKEKKPKKNKPKITPDDDKIVPAGSGSGFFVSKEGHAITNYHVIEGCDINKLSFEGSQIEVKVTAVDKANDIAILKSNVKPDVIFPVSNKDVSLLEDVIVAGFPLGKQISSAIKTHKGVITALAGAGDNYSYFQTDATINEGNSGGPIINQKGNVVGIAVQTWIEEGVQGVHFGIKSSTLKTFASANGLSFASPNNRELSNKDLGELITKGTVYVECHMTVAKIKKMIAQAENRKAFFKEHK